jgi:putative transposase
MTPRTHTVLSQNGGEHRVLTAFVGHYNAARPHRSLDLGVPAPANIAAVTALPSAGRVDRVDVLGGLIHEYRRAA